MPQPVDRLDALRRRRTLWQQGKLTYRVEEVDGQQTILCLCCFRRSFYGEDVKHGYCGFCRAFHEEPPGEEGS